jgi:hypothetical protein
LVNHNGNEQSFSIDEHIIYSIGSAIECEICIPKLSYEHFLLIHHRNGGVYVQLQTESGKATLMDQSLHKLIPGQATRLNGTFEIVTDSNEVFTFRVTGINSKSLKEILSSREGSSDDADEITDPVTRKNTEQNKHISSPDIHIEKGSVKRKDSPDHVKFLQ